MSTADQKPFRGSATIKVTVQTTSLEEAERILQDAVDRLCKAAPHGVTVAENTRQRFIVGPLGDN